jgi:hypothetical protein
MKQLRGAVRFWLRIYNSVLWPDDPHIEFDSYSVGHDDVVPILAKMFSVDVAVVERVMEEERAELAPLVEAYEAYMAERRHQRDAQRAAEKQAAADAKQAQYDENLKAMRDRWAREREQREDQYKEKD